MNENYELTTSDYLAIARRRWLFLVIPFLAIFLGTAAVAVWIPPVYKSTGTILIESQQIPDELIRSTITSYADERIQVIQQLVMTRENLLRVVEKFDLFAEIRDELTVSEQVDLMRERIEIAKVAGDTSKGYNRNRTTIAFIVGFEDSSPDQAHSVANELVTLFLEENVKTRTERASETTEFLTQEAGKLKHDLEVIEEQMAAYKQENSEALPEHLDLHIKMLERTEINIKEVERDIKAAEDENRFLEIELSAIKAGIANSTGQVVVATPEQELVAAEAELVRLKSRYSELHPDVKRQTNHVEKLRAETAALSTDTNEGEEIPTTAHNIDVARVRAQMVSVNERIRSLQEHGKQLESRRRELEEIIIQTPQVQRALTSLNRDYENTLKKYKEIQAKEMEAKLAESLEQGRKAERFSLLEPPIRPDKPIKPDRQKMMALGFFLALAGSLGLVMLLESGDKRIRGSDALTYLLKDRPLVTIPYITNTDEIKRRKRNKLWAMGGAVATGLAVLVGVHFFYMPLDLLFIKVIARLG